MLIKEAQTLTGGLSNPSKMPGHGYSLPNSACRRGGMLQKKAGSVCSGCYASKGRYLFGNVQSALHRRLKSLSDPQWVEAMTTLIAATKVPYFRWHDSGDLQSQGHLRQIFEVCRATPDVQHWMPTKEGPTVRNVLRQQACPPNLTIRVSSDMIDTLDNNDFGALRSMVATSQGMPTAAAAGASVCHATVEHTTCGDCRACWDKKIPLIAYLKH